MKYFTSAAIPRTHPRDEFLGRCKRSCCWSPFGHIPDVKNCECHRKETS